MKKFISILTILLCLFVLSMAFAGCENNKTTDMTDTSETTEDSPNSTDTTDETIDSSDTADSSDDETDATDSTDSTVPSDDETDTTDSTVSSDDETDSTDTADSSNDTDTSDSTDTTDSTDDDKTKEPTIETNLKNNFTYTFSKLTIDVWARKATGEKLATSNVKVLINGEVARINWDDSEKTSYDLEFKEGENIITITAIDGKYSKTVEYTVIYEKAATTITISIDAFTVGLGYIVKPYNLTLNEATLFDMAQLFGFADADEMLDNINGAYMLVYTLEINGFGYDYTGSLSSGFYLSIISGIDTSGWYIDDCLREKLDYIDESGPYAWDELGEFDFIYSSGWMYCVNGVFANVGFSDYMPQDGDVMRVQFTLAYGADIGGSGAMGWGGENYFPDLNKDDITVLIAKALEQGIDISDIVDIISRFDIEQDDIDTAYEELQSRMR